MRRAAAALVVGILLVLPAGGQAAAPRLTVFAAASLTEVFQRIDSGQTYNFAGSNQLAFQLRQGGKADVFASASPEFTQDLFRAGLVERPRLLVTNRLVLIVPRSNPAGLRSVYDLRRKDVKLVVGEARVPVGTYTRQVLRRLGTLSVLDKVVSEEPDVKGVVAKVALGQADAGFVYATDARVAASRLRTISIPASGQPQGASRSPSCARAPGRAARAWVKRVTDGTRARRLLRQAGLGCGESGPSRVQRAPRRRAHGSAAVPDAADRRDLRRDPTGPAARRVAQRRRAGRARGDAADEPDRERSHPARRDPGGVPARDTALPRPRAAAHPRRAAARAAAGGRGHRPHRRVREPGARGRARGGRAGLGGDTGGRRHGRRVRAGPFYVRPAVAAFGAVDRSLLDAARTLGAGPARVFATVAVPLAGAGLGAGAALAFARGLGEFGATIMFAGSLRGVTQTLSLAVYDQLDADFDIALAIGALLVAVSGALLLAVKVVPGWARFASTSTVRSDPSASG